MADLFLEVRAVVWAARVPGSSDSAHYCLLLLLLLLPLLLLLLPLLLPLPPLLLQLLQLLLLHTIMRACG
jgi:hypothetical protein